MAETLLLNKLVSEDSLKTKEECLLFIQENFGYMSLREMARKLPFGRTSICRWAKELGLFTLKNTVNENYFSVWNSNMAYIFGFIFADGNVSWDIEKSRRALTITSAAKDKDHLEKMRLILESTKPLLYSNSTNSYRLIVNNKKICEDLMSLGVVPRKSLIKEFPVVPKEYVSHFIRGYVDGNGTVRYNDRKVSPYFQISICSGSYKFLEKLSEVVDLNLGIKNNVREEKINTYNLQYTCSKGMKFAKWIYDNQNLCLLRKYKGYEKALNVKKEKNNYE